MRAELGREDIRFAAGLAACIVVLAILGALDATIADLPTFDLKGEIHLDRLGEGFREIVNFPALFSGALLAATSGLAFLVAERSERLAWAALGVLFAFMATDELFKVHESLQNRTGVHWQLLYIPVLFLAAVFWLIALGEMRQFEGERTLWLGGAAAWIASQLLEVLAVAGGDNWMPLSGELGGLEEILEMIGSSMFLLTLLLLRRRIPERT